MLAEWLCLFIGEWHFSMQDTILRIPPQLEFYLISLSMYVFCLIDYAEMFIVLSRKVLTVEYCYCVS